MSENTFPNLILLLLFPRIDSTLQHAEWKHLQEADMLCHLDQVTSQGLGCGSAAKGNSSLAKPGPHSAGERRSSP